jgi:CubicO group peptidase (beta-lactamase class C family)
LTLKEFDPMPLRKAGLALAVLMASIAASPPPARADAAAADRIQALIPDLDAYATRGMKVFDVPGLAIGIVVDDRLVYAKGFGVRSKGGAQPVDPRTIFQIGSTTKAFLATSLAILVDRGQLAWDDRVVGRYPAFQMNDPSVTREFRIDDLLAQRSGLPPLVNDMLAMSGFDEAALLGSLRYVEPVSRFRSTFSYTNVTHLLASRIVAQTAKVTDWSTVLQNELLDPLGMKDTTTTAEAIQASPTMRTAIAGRRPGRPKPRSRRSFHTI